jgi:hypothetical protein
MSENEWDKLYEKYGVKKQDNSTLKILLITILVFCALSLTIYFLYQNNFLQNKESQKFENQTTKTTVPTEQCYGILCNKVCHEEIGKCCNEIWTYAAQCCSDLDCSDNKKCIYNLCKEIRQSSVAVFVEEGIYDDLQNEIERYKNDIINDLSSETNKVDVFVYNNEMDRNEIREKIIDLFVNFNLEGVIFIGNIPYYISPPSLPYSPQGFPTDFYYTDIENVYGKSNIYPKIWLYRIKPPINGTEGIELIRNYFDRNHDYRTGKMKFDREVLFYLPSAIEETKMDINYVYSQMEKDIKETKTYTFSKDNIIMPEKKNVESDDEYFRKLKKPYEYVYYNGHGAPTFEEMNITSDEIRQLKPQGMLYELHSCSNGDFTEKNYIAGWYLFSGNGLVVSALTDPAFTGLIPPSIRPYTEFFILEHGGIFGRTELADGISMASTFLGDPTLRLRYEKIKSNAKIRLDENIIDFGNVEAYTKNPKIRSEVEDLMKQGKNPVNFYSGWYNISKSFNITIYNMGSEKLGITAYSFLKKYKEPQIPIVKSIYMPTTSMTCVPYPQCQSSIPPYSSVNYTISFSPPVEGEYEYFWDIYSNDENNYFIRIPIHGNGI